MYGSRLCITKNLHEKVIFKSHVPQYVGHRGIQATTQAIETYLYWPSMHKDILNYVKECLTSQKIKYGGGKATRLLQPLPIPNATRKYWNMDHW